MTCEHPMTGADDPPRDIECPDCGTAECTCGYVRAREIAAGLVKALRDEAHAGWVGVERAMILRIARDIEECRGDFGRAVAAVLAEGGAA